MRGAAACRRVLAGFVRRTDRAGSRGDAPLALMVRAMVIAGEGHPVQIGFIISPPCPKSARPQPQTRPKHGL